MVKTLFWRDGSVTLRAEAKHGEGHTRDLHGETIASKTRCTELKELVPVLKGSARTCARIVSTFEDGWKYETLEFLHETPRDILDAYKKAGLDAFVPPVVKGGFAESLIGSVLRMIVPKARL
ncbi:MAG: hypothetical protein PHE27_03100 [Alphaproteobacteria bacterium]|nr:hypothetical protein [Alphaproteobacteria bacterium]